MSELGSYLVPENAEAGRIRISGELGEQRCSLAHVCLCHVAVRRMHQP